MSDRSANSSWVDRYVRDELTTEEIAEFEIALMDSPALAQELEAALGIREVLALDTNEEPINDAVIAEHHPKSGGWQPVALAATVVLALYSTVMFWKAGNDAAELRRQVELLSQPRTGILTVPVDIMRSTAAQSPDVVVKKPDENSVMVLDIELAPEARQMDRVHFALRDPAGAVVSSWVGQPSPEGRSRVVLNSSQVPAERLWLETSSDEGVVIDRRLLEFR